MFLYAAHVVLHPERIEPLKLSSGSSQTPIRARTAQLGSSFISDWSFWF